MDRFTRVATVAALLFGGAQSASAAVFGFSYTTNIGGTARVTSGTLFTTNTTVSAGGRQAYTILGVTGSQGMANIDRLLPSGTSIGGEETNNLLYTSGRYLDAAGFGFQAAGRTDLTAVYSSGANYREYNGGSAAFDPSTSGAASNFTLVQTAGAVPEASTWVMMIVGFGLVGGTMRRRRSAITTRVEYAA